MRLNVGVSRKVGLPDYGSVGASCNLDLELDLHQFEHDLEGFQARVRDAYVAAHQAVHDELARLQAPLPIAIGTPVRPAARRAAGEGLSRENGGETTPRPPRAGTGGRRSATPNQVKAIQAIARRLDEDLSGLLRKAYGVEQPEDLSVRQASGLIDLLRSRQSIAT
jgi:hypothetical protein